VHHWKETGGRDLASRISSIVKELAQAVVEVARLIEEGERQAELERQRWAEDREKWLREEAERRAAKALKAGKEELLQIIEGWAQAKRLEQFFTDAETRAGDLNDDERLRTLDRLKVAREMVGDIDALRRFMDWKSPAER
jgi:hypothetical protein